MPTIELDVIDVIDNTPAAPTPRVEPRPANEEGLSPQAIHRLEKVIEHALAEPDSVVMDNWLLTMPSSFVFCGYCEPRCGTAGCIAGWAVMLYRQSHELPTIDCTAGEVASLAQQLLGLDAGQAERLFYQKEWPLRFKLMALGLRPQTKAFAKVVVSYIRYFIRTGGQTGVVVEPLNRSVTAPTSPALGALVTCSKS